MQNKIKKIGGSLFFIIPSYAVKILNLKEDDIIEVDIKNLYGEEIIKQYRCLKCNHIFPKSPNEDKYCPACDCENIQIVNYNTKK